MLGRGTRNGGGLPSCRSPRWSTSSTPRSRGWAASAGTHRASSPGVASARLALSASAHTVEPVTKTARTAIAARGAAALGSRHNGDHPAARPDLAGGARQAYGPVAPDDDAGGARTSSATAGCRCSGRTAGSPQGRSAPTYEMNPGRRLSCSGYSSKGQRSCRWLSPIFAATVVARDSRADRTAQAASKWCGRSAACSARCSPAATCDARPASGSAAMGSPGVVDPKSGPHRHRPKHPASGRDQCRRGPAAASCICRSRSRTASSLVALGELLAGRRPWRPQFRLFRHWHRRRHGHRRRRRVAHPRRARGAAGEVAYLPIGGDPFDPARPHRTAPSRTAVNSAADYPPLRGLWRPTAGSSVAGIFRCPRQRATLPRSGEPIEETASNRARASRRRARHARPRAHRPWRQRRTPARNGGPHQGPVHVARRHGRSPGASEPPRRPGTPRGRVGRSAQPAARGPVRGAIGPPRNLVDEARRGRLRR